jgi:hypothetical protein
LHSDLCRRHQRDEAPYGLVTGGIPVGKVEHFVAMAKKRARAVSIDVEAAAMKRSEPSSRAAAEAAVHTEGSRLKRRRVGGQTPLTRTDAAVSEPAMAAGLTDAEALAFASMPDPGVEREAERRRTADAVLLSLGPVLQPDSARSVLSYHAVPPSGWCFWDSLARQLRLGHDLDHRVLACVGLFALAERKNALALTIVGSSTDPDCLARRAAVDSLPDYADVQAPMGEFDYYVLDKLERCLVVPANLPLSPERVWAENHEIVACLQHLGLRAIVLCPEAFETSRFFGVADGAVSSSDICGAAAELMFLRWSGHGFQHYATVADSAGDVWRVGLTASARVERLLSESLVVEELQNGRADAVRLLFMCALGLVGHDGRPAPAIVLGDSGSDGDSDDEAAGGGGCSATGAVGVHPHRDLVAARAEARRIAEDADPVAIAARAERLATAKRDKLSELQGRVLGRLKALQRPVPMNLQSQTYDALRKMYEEMVPRGLREDGEA